MPYVALEPKVVDKKGFSLSLVANGLFVFCATCEIAVVFVLDKDFVIIETKLNFEKAKVWDKHANFIVNKGNATSEDILELMVKMFTAVKENYRIELQPEVVFIGDKTKKEEELCKILYPKTQK